MRLLIMGPPGAGKGTQAAMLADRLGIPAISTGDIFRRNVGERTALGLESERFMNAGEYVPDVITNEMVRNRLTEPDVHDSGFLLDGYPRTLQQVHELDAMLTGALDAVISLEVEDSVVTGRLLERARVDGRVDDTEEVIRRRLEIFARQTAPLVDHYESRGILIKVDGSGPVGDVGDRIVHSLALNRAG